MNLFLVLYWFTTIFVNHEATPFLRWQMHFEKLHSKQTIQDDTMIRLTLELPLGPQITQWNTVNSPFTKSSTEELVGLASPKLGTRQVNYVNENWAVAPALFKQKAADDKISEIHLDLHFRFQLRLRSWQTKLSFHSVALRETHCWSSALAEVVSLTVQDCYLPLWLLLVQVTKEKRQEREEKSLSGSQREESTWKARRKKLSRAEMP